MKASQVPWWGWVLLVLGTLSLLDALDGGLLPLIILGVIGWKVFGKQLSAGAGPRNRVPPAGRPVGGTAAPGERSPWGPPSTGAGHAGPLDRPGGPPTMPTIDVPRYPGSAGTPAPPPPGAPTGRGSAGDPARSLLRLQLSQVGRDLEQALAAGDAGRARQLLEGMDRQLTVGRAEGAQERALHDDVRTALGALTRGSGGVDRAALDRVVARCRAMGQTGHHE
ncbi:hypothetical protein ACQE98_05605 [Ornithinimicrobium sp. W1679]|uniref:hypothetical protein n=1 Tax=Ornithinimicrobium sp. W1679 TaxID=3418770 RepID=UPI003CF16B11